MELRRSFLSMYAAHNAIQKITDHKVVLAGGAVRDFYFGKEVNDYDLFVLGDIDRDAVNNLLMSIQGAFPEAEETSIDSRELDKAYELSPDAFKVVIKLCELKPSPNLPYVHNPIQIIYMRGTEEVEDLIESFDLDICQFAYDGEQFHVGKKVDVEAVKKAMNGKGPVTLLNEGSYARLRKFHRRYGCSVREAARALMQMRRDPKPEKEAGRTAFFTGPGKKEEAPWLYFQEGPWATQKEGEDDEEYLDRMLNPESFEEEMEEAKGVSL